MRKRILFLVIVMVFAAAAVFATPAAAQDVKRMTIEELKGMLGNPDLVIIDVRREGDWKSSTVKSAWCAGAQHRTAQRPSNEKF